MAFFGQISKKLGDVGQNVSQQAKNFAEITRINGKISDNKQQISKLYENVGRKYYEKHKDDPDADESEVLSQIAGLYAEIEEYESKIISIKGTVRCPKCGADVAIGSTFCNVCGEKMVNPGEQTVERELLGICPVCGKPRRKGNVYCNNCGTKFDSADDSSLNPTEIVNDEHDSNEELKSEEGLDNSD